MNSINPSFGNNKFNNINQNLQKQNSQAKQANEQLQFNVGSLSSSQGDSVSFSTKNKEVINEKSPQSTEPLFASKLKDTIKRVREKAREFIDWVKTTF